MLAEGSTRTADVRGGCCVATRLLLWGDAYRSGRDNTFGLWSGVHK